MNDLSPCFYVLNVFYCIFILIVFSKQLFSMKWLSNAPVYSEYITLSVECLGKKAIKYISDVLGLNL